MDLDINNIHLVNAFDHKAKPHEWIIANTEFTWCHIALGETAAEELKKRRVNHFKLPHPSGLNRKLNDKQEISRLLYRCKKYIYE